MRSVVSSLSPHNLHLLFCCILAILALTCLGLMALLCASFKEGLASPKRFRFHSHIHVFLREISLVRCLHYAYRCFSSNFCFLVIFLPLMLELSVLLFVAVIRFPLHFFMLSFLVSMLVGPLHPSFLDTNSMPTSSLGCNALCIVLIFLSSSPFVKVLLWPTLRMVPCILRGVQPGYSYDEISAL